MYCSKCGAQNTSGERFCHVCGCAVETYCGESSQTQQPASNSQQIINKAVNPKMTKWAILSIIIPIVAIIWYIFIGLSFYIAVLIAIAGFEFARKGELANKKLAIAGKVLNGILCGLAIVMLILTFVGQK